MRLGRWSAVDSALAGLRSHEAKDEASILWARAALWQYRRPGADWKKAREIYRDIALRFSDSAEASSALLALARMDDLGVLESQPGAAAAGYRDVMKKYPESRAAYEAAIQLPLALWEAEGVEGAREGAALLSKWMETHPNPEYTGIAELELGKLYRYPLEDFPTAVRHLRRAMEAGLHSDPLKSSTLWTIASLSEHALNDRKTAAEYYSRFLQEFPRHNLSFRAKQALERLGSPAPQENEALPINP